MFKLHLTDEQVLADLAAVVEGREEYVYLDEREEGSGCVYFDDDFIGEPPSCIVGHVLARHGVTLTDLVNAEVEIERHINGSRVVLLTELGLLDISRKAAIALSEAQYAQDDGHTWGYALDQARIAFAH